MKAATKETVKKIYTSEDFQDAPRVNVLIDFLRTLASRSSSAAAILWELVGDLQVNIMVTPEGAFRVFLHIILGERCPNAMPHVVLLKF